MGMDEINQIKNINSLLINAVPVFKGEPNEKLFMQFALVGAVWIKPVYINDNKKLVRRVGDCIYVAFPFGTNKQQIMEYVQSLSLGTKVRKYVSRNLKLSTFPTVNKTGSAKEGFVILEGARYDVKLIPALNRVIALEDNTYYITYRTSVIKAEESFKTWRRELTKKAFAEAMEYVCQLNGLPKPKLKFNVTSGRSFVYRNKVKTQLCVPEGAVALTKKELSVVALFYILCHDYNFDLNQVKAEYPYLHELMFYVVKRLGLGIERDSTCHKMEKIFSDNYLARHGEKAYSILDQVLLGKGKVYNEKLHLCASL